MHSGLHLLSELLLSDDVHVLCIQEVNAGEFQSFLRDQDFSSEGPSSSFGPEAGFLVSDAITCVISLTEFRSPLPSGGLQ